MAKRKRRGIMRGSLGGQETVSKDALRWNRRLRVVGCADALGYCQVGRMRLQGVDDELDMLGKINAEVSGAAGDVFAVDGAGKAFRLHLFLDAGRVHVAD